MILVSRISGVTCVSTVVQAVATVVSGIMDVLVGVMINIFNYIVTLRMDMNAFNVRRTARAVLTTTNAIHVSQINGETFVSTVVPVVVTLVT